nr:MAG TPA: hypothetical protein [Caudoviricetes sp.]
MGQVPPARTFCRQAHPLSHWRRGCFRKFAE